MKKIIAHPLSVVYYFFFGFFLLLFHPMQWLALKAGSYTAHKKTVDILSFFLVGCLYILGTRISFKNRDKIPKNVPLVIASNHQSMNDIPPYFWFLRKFHPKFVAKKELGKNIPSVSINLKHGGSALIDRKDGKQAIGAILTLGKYIEKNNYAAIIFPEGTRSRNGVPKKFSENGLKMLVKSAPSAYVIPISINNSYQFLKYGGFPLGIGIKLSFEVHNPIKANSLDFKTLFNELENQIKTHVIVV